MKPYLRKTSNYIEIIGINRQELELNILIILQTPIKEPKPLLFLQYIIQHIVNIFIKNLDPILKSVLTQNLNRNPYLILYRYKTKTESFKYSFYKIKTKFFYTSNH